MTLYYQASIQHRTNGRIISTAHFNDICNLIYHIDTFLFDYKLVRIYYTELFCDYADFKEYSP